MAERLIRFALSLLAALSLAQPSAAAPAAPSEQLVRAAMVFNFLRFTDFPRGTLAGNGDILLCTEVDDPHQQAALADLSGRRIGDHRLVVVENARRPSSCQVIYTDSRRRWDTIEDMRALTIGSYPGFLADGGIIEVAVHNDGTQFDVNLAQSRRAGIHFAPQLLLLARHVAE